MRLEKKNVGCYLSKRLYEYLKIKFFIYDFNIIYQTNNNKS